jgi:hypothetical protein
LAILSAVSAAGCSGQIGDNLTGGDTRDIVTQGGGGGGTGPGPEATCKASASFASARVALLTDDQYVNVIRDVFGVTVPPEVTGPKSASGEYNINVENAQVGTTMVQAYMRAADTIAGMIKPCGNASVTAACMEQYLRTKLPLAWRRPVDDSEMRALIDGVFTPAIGDGADRAVKLTMEAALGAGDFLYRSEVGENAQSATGHVDLTPHELASAVSFALLNSVPDAELWARAQDGTITQRAVLSAQVDRLMTLPTARDNLRRKVSFYLNFEKVPLVTKDPATYPQFTALKDAIYQGSQMFLDDVLWNPSGFKDLFTSRKIYANAAVASAYGLPAVTGTELVPVNTTGAAYSAGVLTQPALLLSSNHHANSDDIVHRGLWVYGNVACGISFADPPKNAAAVFATLTGTERERALKRDNLAACGGCHKSFDPFGLMTENYDPIGRYRAIDPETNGPVDTSATIAQLGDDIDGPVKDVNDVAQKFINGRRASDCAATRLAKYTIDHNPDVEGSCRIQDVKDAFAKSGSFPDLFRAILTDPAFFTRDL